MRLLIALLVLGTLTLACLTAAPAMAARNGATITTRQVGSYGRVLVDGRGLPLYDVTRDQGTS